MDQSLHHAERLPQSILKRAFEGKLVEQDPSDELAGVLLKIIRMEKMKRVGEQMGWSTKGALKKLRKNPKTS